MDKKIESELKEEEQTENQQKLKDDAKNKKNRNK